jgi:hypothetical protein
MTPLTPERVAKLRLPDGVELRNIGSTSNPCWYWSVTPGKDADPSFDTAMRHLATIAGWVANGDLPPESLDDVWRRAEGTKTDLDVVLEYRAVEIHKGRDGSNCWITLFPCNGEPCKTFDGVVLSEVLAAARKWIEEKKP